MSNNSDQNDFDNWQNGDEYEMNNPNNMGHGFFIYSDPKFREIWKKIQNNQDPRDVIRDYLNIDDVLNQYKKQSPQNKYPRKNPKQKQKNNNLSQDEYFKLIEIRGYLAITEQLAHVKALDKLLNQITIVSNDQRKPDGGL